MKEAAESGSKVGIQSNVTSSDPVSTPPTSVGAQPTTAPQVRSNGSKGCITALLAVVVLFFLCMVCSIVPVVLGIYSADVSETTSVTQEGGIDKIAVINVAGIIQQNVEGSLFATPIGATPDRVRSDLNRALNDDSVKAIILQIESPGGEAVASDVMRNYVANAKTQKPVVVYSSGILASGGYMVAVEADKIVVHPGVITGSIGVILQTQNIDGLYEKLGIRSVTFKSGDFKDDAQLFDGVDGELEAIYQGIVDESYNDFVNKVAAGRGISRAEVLKLADGRLYTGNQAVNVGLADRVGYFAAAISEAEMLAEISNSTIIEYGKPTFFELLFETKGAGLLTPSVSSTTGFGVYYLPAMMR